DAIREEVVTSMVVTLGSEGNLLQESPEQARLLRIDQPILLDKELAAIKALDESGFKSRTLSMLYSKAGGKNALKQRLDELKAEASKAVEDGVTILVLSDRGVSEGLIPVPALLATGCVHHHLTKEGTRSHCGLVIESGEPREVHHFALLIGFGAGAINPYLAFATIRQMQAEGIITADKAPEILDKNFAKAGSKGVLKVMSKMGISTLQSYRGSQIFEAVGLDKSVIDEYFVNTPSRIQGIGLETIAVESELRHSHGWPAKEIPQVLDLDVGGQYAWRRKGEYHLHNPDVVAKLQQATKINSAADFKKYCQLIDEQQEHLCTLRGLLKFKFGTERVPLAEVEPVTEIVKRFATGAMSFGSISKEAHETLAIAMNRIGAKSNTGEGGEDAARFTKDENGDNRRSAIKQVASGRFGVTSEYLVNSDELQIKMAQGAKPGEGGQLPGSKVDEFIGKVRHSTPGVGLISPPPHHDIYSIEDLAQLIHDLKNANHHARVAVKLVAEVGVGTVAAGVAKGKADVVLVSGYDGGTGASPQTSIKHAGLPWELGLAETHQVLLKNDLRSRVVLQTDGQIRTPKDVVIAALLGAEEWGVATAALVVTGCIMMRKCHLNTCPVGIATQDPELRKKFAGKPEYVVNFFFMLAEGVREIMADLGVRTVNELIGRVELLEIRQATDHWKARGLDLSTLLFKPRVNESYGTFCSHQQDHEIDKSLDMTTLLDLCAPALEAGQPVKAELPIRNINRTVGTILSSEITRKYGGKGLPEDTIQIDFRGTAGQSCLAFGSPGVTFRVEGDVNDYVGKGLSGGKIIVFPDRTSPLVAEDNIIAGNVALYGATAGQLYVRGVAGERFCVRNSGADAVVEGVGDHGCEYMTGGNVVVLGRTGRNFAAGMSGGVAYVYDVDGNFKQLVNMEMVAFEDLDAEDVEKLQTLIGRHVEYTGSVRGKQILDDWSAAQAKFVKIMPIDYRKALNALAAKDLTAPALLAGTTK
ncbi:MAG TPA: glutamate synthase large subunit, partial [Pirellulales bacterium]